jgi:glycosyltransferase involved in cell wall biosynthesis
MPDVILPALNEAAAIPWVLSRMPDGYRPIVVDNGSTDRTAELAAEHGALVVSEEQKGFGAACWAGLQASTPDIVCFMDCDASLDPLALPLVTAYVEQGDADLVIGSRIAVRGAWPPEMVLRAVNGGLKVRNVPVEYAERSGRSRVTGTIGGTARAVKDMGRILREIP